MKFPAASVKGIQKIIIQKWCGISLNFKIDFFVGVQQVLVTGVTDNPMVTAYPL